MPIPQDDFDGCSLQGYEKAKYSDIERALGKPRIGPNAKDVDKGTTCEWSIKFSDGVACTIYDIHQYCFTAKGEYLWHIGGKSPEVLEKVQNLGEVVLRTLPQQQHETEFKESLSQKEKIVHQLAEKHLKTRYNVSKSNGFQQWLKEPKS